jgi:RNA polymerase sigma factor (TIGR02999 family)
MSEVTQLLSQIDSGDRHAPEQLLSLVYDELRRLAAAKLAYEKPGNTLQTTALVHEAYLRLVGPAESNAKEPSRWESRGHFFSAAAEAMRRILVDSARRKRALKRGGGQHRVDVEPADSTVGAASIDLLALDEALARFATLEPRKAELVKLRFFAGLTMAEAAQALGISLAAAERHWTFARTWLFAAMSDQPARASARLPPPGQKK